MVYFKSALPEHKVWNHLHLLFHRLSLDECQFKMYSSKNGEKGASSESSECTETEYLARPTFPSTSSFMITAGGTPSSFSSGILDKFDLRGVNKKGPTFLLITTIYLLVATTLLMKSAILIVATDVVSSPAPQLSRICPPIPSEVKVMIMMMIVKSSQKS